MQIKSEENSDSPRQRRKTSEEEHYKEALPKRAEGKIVGVDLHPDSITVVVMQGVESFSTRVVERRGPMSLEFFLEWSRKNFGRDDLFLIEASGNSFEVCQRLRQAGLRAAVLESCSVGRYAPKGSDNDKLAAERIVRAYLTGFVSCVWTPDDQTRERRDLLHAYSRAVRDCTARSNALKGYLNGWAIRLGKRSLKKAETQKWVLSQRAWGESQILILEEHFQGMERATHLRKKLHSIIGTQVVSNPLMLRTMKLLGIGVINAFATVAVVGEVRRFSHASRFASYLGLVPVSKKSGAGKESKIGIGGCRGRRDLRCLLIQAAQVLMRSRKPNALTKWSRALCNRKGHRNIAAAALARKLAERLWHLLIGEAPEGMEKESAFITKMRSLLTLIGSQARTALDLNGTLAQDALQLCRRLNLTSSPPSP